MKLIRIIRIAPYGSVLIASQLLSLTVLGYAYVIRPGSSDWLQIFLLGLLVVGTVFLSVDLIRIQLRVERRLAKVITELGYNDRIFAETVPTYCDRQTARVVCESFGVLPEYERTCGSRSDEQKLKWIPHI